MGVDVKISEKIQKKYLVVFEIAVKEGQPAAIMSSYNLVNGVHAANSKDLCTRIVRKEWGFDGVIMSDWNTTVPEDGSVSKCFRQEITSMPGNAEDAKIVKHTETEILQKKKSVPVQAGFLQTDQSAGIELLHLQCQI